MYVCFLHLTCTESSESRLDSSSLGCPNYLEDYQRRTMSFLSFVNQDLRRMYDLETISVQWLVTRLLVYARSIRKLVHTRQCARSLSTNCLGKKFLTFIENSIVFRNKRRCLVFIVVFIGIFIMHSRTRRKS